MSGKGATLKGANLQQKLLSSSYAQHLVKLNFKLYFEKKIFITLLPKRYAIIFMLSG